MSLTEFAIQYTNYANQYPAVERIMYGVVGSFVGVLGTMAVKDWLYAPLPIMQDENTRFALDYMVEKMEIEPFNVTDRKDVMSKVQERAEKISNLTAEFNNTQLFAKKTDFFSTDSQGTTAVERITAEAESCKEAKERCALQNLALAGDKGTLENRVMVLSKDIIDAQNGTLTCNQKLMEALLNYQNTNKTLETCLVQKEALKIVGEDFAKFMKRPTVSKFWDAILGG